MRRQKGDRRNNKRRWGEDTPLEERWQGPVFRRWLAKGKGSRPGWAWGRWRTDADFSTTLPGPLYIGSLVCACVFLVFLGLLIFGPNDGGGNGRSFEIVFMSFLGALILFTLARQRSRRLRKIEEIERRIERREQQG